MSYEIRRGARHAADTRAAFATAAAAGFAVMLAGGWYPVRLIGAVRWMERVVAQ